MNGRSALGLPLALLMVTALPVSASAAGTWVPTGSMGTARSGHTATVLMDGRVLVAGGAGPLASAELYHPALRTWSTTGAMANARFGHTATLLPSGKVLVVGGQSGPGYLASAELYDPSTGTWTAARSMATPRTGHTATLLPFGRVLVVGGFAIFVRMPEGLVAGYLNSAETYDPASNSWEPAGLTGMATPRAGHTATLLPSGKVLVVGGRKDGSTPLSSAEIYEGYWWEAWSATAPMATARAQHTATLLPSGKVLVVGGTSTSATSAELYDPASGTWSATGSVAQARYYGHTATLLATGQVILAGGMGPDFPGSAGSVELYDPPSGTWSATGSMGEGRYGHIATLLASGEVLAAGGQLAERLASAEVYVPANTAPVAAADRYTVYEDAMLAVPAPGLLVNDTDADGDALTAVLGSRPTYGRVDPGDGSFTDDVGRDGAFRYTPTADFNGTDRFAYRATDGALPSEPATVVVTVIAVNDPPSFGALASPTVLEDAAVQSLVITGIRAGPENESAQTVTITATSSRPAIVPDPVVSAVSSPGPGIPGTATLSYRPAPNMFGSTTITVTAKDDGGTAGGGVDTFSLTFTITVQPVNDAPVAVDDTYRTSEDTTLTVGGKGFGGGVTENDTDVDGPACWPCLWAVLVDAPRKGTLTLEPNGWFTYVPYPNENGIDEFRYRVSDGELESANVATVRITIDPVNDVPVAYDDAYSTEKLTPLAVRAPGLLGNDIDVDRDTLTPTVIDPPDLGTLLLNADGSFTYTPGPRAIEGDRFAYLVSDGVAKSNGATVIITIVAGPPVEPGPPSEPPRGPPESPGPPITPPGRP